jgi:hypothetical protein
LWWLFRCLARSQALRCSRELPGRVALLLRPPPPPRAELSTAERVIQIRAPCAYAIARAPLHACMPSIDAHNARACTVMQRVLATGTRRRYPWGSISVHGAGNSIHLPAPSGCHQRRPVTRGSADGTKCDAPTSYPARQEPPAAASKILRGGNKFSKILYAVTLHSKYSRALIFLNLVSFRLWSMTRSSTNCGPPLSLAISMTCLRWSRKGECCSKVLHVVTLYCR